MDIEKISRRNSPKIDKAIEKYIPRKFTKDAVLFKVNPPLYSYTLSHSTGQLLTQSGTCLTVAEKGGAQPFSTHL